MNHGKARGFLFFSFVCLVYFVVNQCFGSFSSTISQSA